MGTHIHTHTKHTYTHKTYIHTQRGAPCGLPSVYVCMFCVCMYVLCVCMCVFVCMYVCVCTYVCVYVCLCVVLGAFKKPPRSPSGNALHLHGQVAPLGYGCTLRAPLCVCMFCVYVCSCSCSCSCRRC